MEEMKHFYTDVLEMDLIHESSISFTVIAGTTKITFEQQSALPYYHICFRSGFKFHDYMFNKLAERSLLLSDKDGGYSMFWQGKQAYFVDPDGNVLELLERPFTHDEDYTPDDWFDVGEMGLPVENVQEMRHFIKEFINDDAKEVSDTFSFYGDNDGVLVIVKEGRPWYPTDRKAEIHPIRMVVSGEANTKLIHPNYPYEIIVKKEWEDSIPAVQMRIARPTNQIDKLTEFYTLGLGLKQIGEFRNHDGYDGVMLGLPGFPYHLEFTQYEKPMLLPEPTKEHLLVFYLPNKYKQKKIANRLLRMGYEEVDPENPYWARGGITIKDPDGWCVVLMNTVGI